MIKLFSVIVISLAIATTFTACKKQEGAATKAGAVSIDTSSAQEQLRTVEPEIRVDFDKALEAIKNANYTEALSKLQAIGTNAKLTPEQRQAVRDLVAKVQQAMAGSATKALDDVQKSLPK